MRLHLAGMRPIDALVDATNYAMLEIGEPLHAFDYDILMKRAKSAGCQSPKIITRPASQGERLVTLDGADRTLDDFTVMVCDQSGPLALAGVMGGEESEISEETVNVLLEGASWNMVNTRRTVMKQNLNSEAAYRFTRGVHPTLAPKGVRRGLQLMKQWAGGSIAKGLVDEYPLPPESSTVVITTGDVSRLLGIELTPEEIEDILNSLDFAVDRDGNLIKATAPDHRLDIGTGVVGKADLLEEIARIYGYERIPETRLADALPPQKSNREMDIEERLRDTLVAIGLQEVITHRLTSPENETRRLSPETPADDMPYFEVANPISPERSVMRHSLLASVLEIVERNARVRKRIAVFEINPVFLASEDGDLPEEIVKLVIAITGPRNHENWDGADTTPMDFFDLKGMVEKVLNSVHISGLAFRPGTHPSFHPGKCALVLADGNQIGILGELHPQVREVYDLPDTPVMAGEFNLDAIISAVPDLYDVPPIPIQPPILEDIALIVDEDIPASQVEAMIRQTGGKIVSDIRLFDVFRGEQIGSGKKSLAYSLTYQDPERTLTDKDAARIRNKIVRRLENELGAKLRSFA
jgi:phenylalanyl-tRNA synthetase beta chain